MTGLQITIDILIASILGGIIFSLYVLLNRVELLEKRMDTSFDIHETTRKVLEMDGE